MGQVPGCQGESEREPQQKVETIFIPYDCIHSAVYTVEALAQNRASTAESDNCGKKKKKHKQSYKVK